MASSFASHYFLQPLLCSKITSVGSTFKICMKSDHFLWTTLLKPLPKQCRLSSELCNSLLTDFSPPLLPLNTLFSSKQSEEYGRPLNIGVTWCSPSTKLRVYNLEWALCIYSSIYLDSTNWVSCSTVKFTIERNPHINELKQFKHFLFRVTCTLQSQVILNLVLTCYLSR